MSKAPAQAVTECRSCGWKSVLDEDGCTKCWDQHANAVRQHRKDCPVEADKRHVTFDWYRMRNGFRVDE
jgi:hypothetical protein